MKLSVIEPQSFLVHGLLTEVNEGEPILLYCENLIHQWCFGSNLTAFQLQILHGIQYNFITADYLSRKL